MSKFPLGLLPDRPETRAVHRSCSAKRKRPLLSSNIPFVQPIRWLLDQEDTPSCVGHAAASVVDSQLTDGTRVSATDLWTESRRIQGDLWDADQGTRFEFTVEVLKNQGYRRYRADDIENVHSHTSQSPADLLEAFDHRQPGIDHEVVDPGLSDAVARTEDVLLRGFGAAIGIMVKSRFMDISITPGRPETIVTTQFLGGETGLGGHEMRAGGFFNVGGQKRVLLINSWKDWGGCYLPPGAILDASLRNLVVRLVDGRIYLPQCVWADASVLEAAWDIHAIKLKAAA